MRCLRSPWRGLCVCDQSCHAPLSCAPCCRLTTTAWVGQQRGTCLPLTIHPPHSPHCPPSLPPRRKATAESAALQPDLESLRVQLRRAEANLQEERAAREAAERLMLERVQSRDEARAAEADARAEVVQLEERLRSLSTPPGISGSNSNTQGDKGRFHRQSSRVFIFWDIENLGVPRKCSAYRLAFRVLEYLDKRGVAAKSESHITFRAYYRPHCSNLSFTAQRDLTRAGVELISVPSNKMEAADRVMENGIHRLVMAPELDALKSTIVLISGDYDFVDALEQARLKGFRVVIVHDVNLSGQRKDGYQRRAHGKMLPWEDITGPVLAQAEELRRAEKEAQQRAEMEGPVLSAEATELVHSLLMDRCAGAEITYQRLTALLQEVAIPPAEPPLVAGPPSAADRQRESRGPGPLPDLPSKTPAEELGAALCMDGSGAIPTAALRKVLRGMKMAGLVKLRKEDNTANGARTLRYVQGVALQESEDEGEPVPTPCIMLFDSDESWQSHFAKAFARSDTDVGKPSPPKESVAALPKTGVQVTGAAAADRDEQGGWVASFEEQEAAEATQIECTPVAGVANDEASETRTGGPPSVQPSTRTPDDPVLEILIAPGVSISIHSAHLVGNRLVQHPFDEHITYIIRCESDGHPDYVVERRYSQLQGWYDSFLRRQSAKLPPFPPVSPSRGRAEGG